MASTHLPGLESNGTESGVIRTVSSTDGITRKCAIMCAEVICSRRTYQDELSLVKFGSWIFIDKKMLY